MIKPEDILGTLSERRNACGTEKHRIEEIERLYQNELEVALPELQANEKSVAANLVQLGVDSIGMRIASVQPNVQFWAEQVGSKRAEQRARLRRDVILGWHTKNRMQLKIYQRARWLPAYGSAPVMLRPDPDGLPIWENRHPLTSYPDLAAGPDDLVPQDAIFTYKRSRSWLETRYPDTMRRLSKGQTKSFDVIEYVGPDDIVLMVLAGKNDNPYYPADGSAFEILHQIPNRTGRPLAVVPGRITVNRQLGQFDGMVGMYQMQARMLALYAIAMEKSVWPETWIQGQQGLGTPNIVTMADSREGIVGVIENGTIQKVDMSPNPMGPQLADRLEYAERMTAGIPAEFGGMSSSNIRTGRRGDSVMAAAVDFRIQEYQTIFEESLIEENKIAIAIGKAYAGSKTFSMHIPGRGTITYNPKQAFAVDDHEVRYAYAGADANSLTIATAQKIGVGILSKESAMEIDPMVRDSEVEKDRITSERLEDAFLQSIAQQAANPMGPYQPADFARILTLVKTDQLELAEAVQKVDDEIKQRQAQAAQGQASPTDQQPGLATPGAPGAPAAIPGPSSSVQNLSQLLMSLRTPQRTVPAERMPPSGQVAG